MSAQMDKARGSIRNRCLRHKPTAPGGAAGNYVIRLVPELDPRRIKLGFAEDVAIRLAQHKTAAPTAVLVTCWPCKRSWEGTAIDCLASSGCRLILNEVFECEDIEALVARGDQFFKLLPAPDQRSQLSEYSPHNT